MTLQRIAIVNANDSSRSKLVKVYYLRQQGGDYVMVLSVIL